jgi:hypothetical protein
MQSNRRTQPRNDINLIVEIKSPAGLENYHLGMTKNISAEGFTLESQNYNIKPGQVLEIDIKLPDSDQSIAAIGKVLWVKVTEFECHTGIIFMRLDEEAKNRMAQLFSSAEPAPEIDMHHDHVPDSRTTNIEGPVSEAVSTSSDTNVPVNDALSIPEDSHIADNIQPFPPDGKIIQPAAISDTKENIPLHYSRDEISREEPPRFSAPEVKRRSAAKILARKKRNHVPLAIISIVTVVAIASVLGAMKWKSKAPAPDPALTALNETEPVIINQEPAQLETPGVQDSGKEQEIADDVSGEGPPIIRAAAKPDNELKEKGLHKESVPIQIPGNQPPAPELNETVTIIIESPPESSASSIPHAPAVNKDIPTVKHTEATAKEIEIIPADNKPETISIPETETNQAYLEHLRQIRQEYEKTQKSSEVTKQDEEKAPFQINENKDHSPEISVPEAPEPITDRTVIAKAGQSDTMSSAMNDTLSGTEPGPWETGIASAALDAKKSVSEQLSSSPDDTEKETINEMPDEITLLPAAGEKQNPAPGSITSSISPQTIKDNNTREIIASSTAGAIKRFDETFDHNANDWDIFNTGSASAQIRDGAYIIENKRKEGAHLILHHQDFPAASDFSIETSIRLLKKSAASSFGLVFGASDSFNNYAFQITTNRHYIVRNFHEGISKEMTMGNKGAADFNISTLNKLKIVRRGDNMRFYINDNLVDTITDLRLYGKRVGFIIDGRSKIAVEHMHSEIQVSN